jgi:hypothetical protein
MKLSSICLHKRSGGILIHWVKPCLPYRSNEASTEHETRSGARSVAVGVVYLEDMRVDDVVFSVLLSEKTSVFARLVLL